MAINLKIESRQSANKKKKCCGVDRLLSKETLSKIEQLYCYQNGIGTARCLSSF